MRVFLNRVMELSELDRFEKKEGLIVVTGRRRIGKSRLLTQWLNSHAGCYSQAIEGQADLQIEQLYEDLKGALHFPVQPKSWPEFLSLLSRVEKRFCLCIDEFPYLVKSSPELPSLLQKWLDHQNTKGSLIILSGSSVRMLNSIFLNSKAPLYGRANRILNIQPMAYSIFCEAVGIPPQQEDSFIKFSLVGGIPKYWEWIEAGESPLEIVDRLYFGFSPPFEKEPQNLLTNENIHGLIPTSILEAIGRGSHRPSEIAARLQLPQQNLSKIFPILLETQLLCRDIPYGESEKSPKKTLYRILDPVCRFWFQVYSPHRSRWYQYSQEEKLKLIRLHASSVFEDTWRNQYPDCKRYWEKNLEFDGIRQSSEGHIVTEVKFTTLTDLDRKRVFSHLQNQWHTSQASKKLEQVKFEVIDWVNFLG
jgi:AAA+ ATPase superfamily predicted ATPase